MDVKTQHTVANYDASSGEFVLDFEMFGVPIRSIAVVPQDIHVFSMDGRPVRVVALTEEAEPVAKAFAKLAGLMTPEEEEAFLKHSETGDME